MSLFIVRRLKDSTVGADRCVSERLFQSRVVDGKKEQLVNESRVSRGMILCLCLRLCVILWL